MSKGPISARFIPPVMQAFRSSFAARDSSKLVDERNEGDERIVAGRRTTPRNAISESVLKQELAFDLQSLLNTVNLAAASDLDELPEVRKSILNFGVDDLTAITSDTRAAVALDRRLREILIVYEPRLVRESIVVTLDKNQDGSDARLAFRVSAEMRASPHDIAVEFVADVETYSGQISVKDA